MTMLDLVTSYLNKATAKVDFLDELASSGHKDEARTLCLVYIDRLAQILSWPSEKSGEIFVNTLIGFGEDPWMGRFYPLQLARALSTEDKLKPFSTEIAAAFPGPSYQLMDAITFEKEMRQKIPKLQLSLLQKHAWKATVANIAYKHLRVPAIHGLGSSGDLNLNATYNGTPAPILDLQRFKKCAIALIKEARRRS
jgi:hypothetical protein